jgi:hypothetical protein
VHTVSATSTCSHNVWNIDMVLVRTRFHGSTIFHNNTSRIQQYTTYSMFPWIQSQYLPQRRLAPQWELTQRPKTRMLSNVGLLMPNGMSFVGLTKARELLQDFRELFQIRLGSDPPAKIPPLKSSTNHTSHLWMTLNAGTLRRSGSSCLRLSRSCNLSVQYAPILGHFGIQRHRAVPKAGSEGNRFTVDLRHAKRTNRADGVQHAALGVDVPVRPGQPMLCKNRSFVKHIGNPPPPSSSRRYSQFQMLEGIYTRLIQGSTGAGK